MQEGFSSASRLEAVNETPQFIKEFSRENSPEERDALAAAIREKRRERDIWRNENAELIGEQERLVTNLNELKDKIEGYNSAAFLQKITDYLEYRKLQADFAKVQTAHGETEQAVAEREETPPQFEEPKRMLEDFYQGEEKKWAEAGYTKEEIQEHFSEENLSKLTLDEYALLMKRFPGEMVTHVTRQGIRDHNAMFEHSAHMGEQEDGFKKILESGRLLSSFEAALSQFKTNEDVRTYLNFWNFPQEEALPGMVNFLKKLRDENYVRDKTAIHFAVEGVVNGIYGGERGNEVFLAYPSAMVASQMKFHADPTGYPPESSGGVHSPQNDVFVWTDERRGIDIDAGITFIPRDALVDSETGSLYQRDENNLPIEEKVSEQEREANHLYFKKARNPIHSEEYWERYFLSHPEQRPSKIVYYDTLDSPTEALWKWKEDNGIIKEGTTAALGFSENIETREDLSSVSGMEARATHSVDRDYVKEFNALAVSALVSEYPVTSIMMQYNAENGGYPQSREEADKLLKEIYMKDVD